MVLCLEDCLWKKRLKAEICINTLAWNLDGSYLISGGDHLDSFARLYDIRKQPLSSIAELKDPPSCVKYYCPKHLSKGAITGQMTWRRGKEITHVAFKSDGLEALVNYYGDHVYLMDIKKESLEKVVNREKLKNVVGAGVHEYDEPEEYGSDGISIMTNFLTYREYMTKVGSDEELEPGFKKFRDDLRNEVAELTPYHAIERLSSSLTLPYPRNFETYERLCTRASLFLQRNWYKDSFMALRDCYAARDMDHSDYKLYYTLAEVLLQVKLF